MEKKINIAELLKDCPIGMELDCTNYDGVVKFDGFNKDNPYAIRISVNHDGEVTIQNLTKYGQTGVYSYYKCVIFPKGKTTWEGFIPPCKFKIEKGKWYVCTKDLLDNYANKAFCKGDTYLSTQDGSLIPSNSNVPFEVVCPDTYFRDWTIEDAKDGDVLTINWYQGDDYWEKIIIFKKYHNKGRYCYSPCVEGYGNTFKNGKLAIHPEVPYFSKTWTACLHPANKEQRDLLFQKMKEAGYKWNPETKTPEKLPKFKVGDRVRNKNYKDYIYEIYDIIDKGYLAKGIKTGAPIPILFGPQEDNYELVPNKFDITTLKPFDKVLWRQGEDSLWLPSFFGFYNEEGIRNTFVCSSGFAYEYCIPYEGNEHLLGKTDDCDEYYKTWE